MTIAVILKRGLGDNQWHIEAEQRFQHSTRHEVTLGDKSVTIWHSQRPHAVYITPLLSSQWSETELPDSGIVLSPDGGKTHFDHRDENTNVTYRIFHSREKK